MQVTNAAPDSTLIEDFRRNLRVLEREVVRQLAQETGCCGVTIAQCHALLELSGAEMSLSALAAALDLDISTLSRTVEGMVKCGFVERTEDRTDRRSVRLKLTGAGRHKVAVINTTCNRYYGAVLERMNGRDQKCVLRAVSLLAGLMRELRSQATAAAGTCCDTTGVDAGSGMRRKGRSSKGNG